MVRPDRVAGDPQTRVIGKHPLAAAIGDLLSGGEPSRMNVQGIRGSSATA
jgi:hypothetical protein